MSARVIGRAFAGVVALGAAACANVLGLGDYADAPGDGGGGGTQGGGGRDAAGGVFVGDGAAVTSDALAGGFTIPAGWGLVAFADSAQTACPAGFGTAPVDLVGRALNASACTCDACTVTGPPSCVTGPIGLAYDTDGSRTCTTPFTALANASPGGCNTDNFHGQIAFGFDLKVTPPGPTGGACSVTATKHGDDAFAERARACGPDSDQAAGCTGSTCAPISLPAPFTACVSKAGDVACPAGPFSVAHHLGTGGTYDCASTCTCAVSATCTGGSLTYYTDPPCKMGPLSVPATATCVTQGGNGATYASYKYSATASAPTCTTGGASSASNVALASVITICCAP